jgi:hypothetical protein
MVLKENMALKSDLAHLRCTMDDCVKVSDSKDEMITALQRRVAMLESFADEAQKAESAVAALLRMNQQLETAQNNTVSCLSQGKLRNPTHQEDVEGLQSRIEQLQLEAVIKDELISHLQSILYNTPHKV